MSLLAQIVIAGLIFIAGFGGGIKWEIGVIAARDLKATNDAALAKMRRDEKVDLAADKHEQFKTEAKVREVTVEKEVERVVQNTVYRNVCLDDAGLRIISDDIGARHTAGQPASTVSSPAKP